jgi:hypothetical protein
MQKTFRQIQKTHTFYPASIRFRWVVITSKSKIQNSIFPTPTLLSLISDQSQSKQIFPRQKKLFSEIISKNSNTYSQMNCSVTGANKVRDVDSAPGVSTEANDVGDKQPVKAKKPRKKQVKTKKPRKEPSATATLDQRRLIDEFNKADQEGESFAMAVAYKRISFTHTNRQIDGANNRTDDLLDIKARIIRGCAVLKQRINDMIALLEAGVVEAV